MVVVVVGDRVGIVYNRLCRHHGMARGMERPENTTHRSDPASGRSSRNGATGLPQSVSEHDGQRREEVQRENRKERWIGGREREREEERKKEKGRERD